MKSNSKAGAGYLSVTAGTTALASIGSSSSGVAFNNASWNGSYTASYTNVTPTMTNSSYAIQDGENVVIVIGATANSLYCQSFKISYEDSGAPTVSSISVKTEPTKVSYTEGECFDPTGLVITKNMSNEENIEVEYNDETRESFSFSPSLTKELSNETKVTITYDNKSIEQAITVNPFTPIAGTYEIKINKALYDNQVSGNNGTEQSIVKKGITIISGCSSDASSKTYYDNSHIRYYAKSYLKLSAPTGFKITKVVFTADDTWNSGPKCGNNGSYNNSTKTWEGSTSQLDLTFGDQNRISSIAVTYGKAKTLQSVTVSGTPTKTTYTAGDSFDPAGLTVTGTYDDNSQETITEGITWSTPATLTAGQTSVSITATVNEINSAEYIVNGLTVNAPKTLTSIAVSGTPNKTTYIVDDTFDPAGLTVTGTYSDNSTEVFTEGITWSTPATLTTGQTSVAITATVKGVTSAEYTVNGLTVNAIPEKTIAEFIASEGGKCYLTGTVSNITNTTFGNFDLTDESGTIYIYGCLNAAGEAKKFAELDVVAGDKIKVLASEYELYYEKHEAKNVKFVEEIKVEKPKYTVTIETPENGTFVVMNGKTTVTSGAQFEEGETLDVTLTPAEGYRVKNWQAIDTSTHTYTSVTSYTMTANDVTLKANFELVPTYTIAWMVNGEEAKSEQVYPDVPVSAPAVDPVYGKVFRGWIAEEIAGTTDETPSFINVTNLTVNENKVFYAVFATQTYGATETNEITYNTENIPTSYGDAADIVLNGMTFNITQMYKNGEKMQWRAAGNKAGTGTMFNKTAINGIQSISITYTTDDTNKNFSVKVGSTENPTSGTEISAVQDGETNTYTYDCSSIAPSYFVFTNGTGAGYLSSIIITSRGTTYSDYCTTIIVPATETLAFKATTDNTHYWATFSHTENVVIPEMSDIEDEVAQITVYSVTVDGDELKLASLENDCKDRDNWNLPKDNGYLIECEFTGSNAPSVNYTFAEESMGTAPTSNLLKPATEEMEGDCKFYKLSKSEGKLGFFYGATDGAKFTMTNKNGAYLAVPNNIQVKAFTLDAIETAIQNVEMKKYDTKIYNLQGQRVDNAQKGIYIINGRKVVK